MHRLRKLCSKDVDFKSAIKNLETRCINSRYDVEIVSSILNQAKNLTRSLVPKKTSPTNAYNDKVIRWIVLSGPFYEKS